MKTIQNLMLCVCVVMSMTACGGILGEEDKDDSQEVVLLESSMTVREFYQRIDDLVVKSYCHRAFTCPEKEPLYSWAFSNQGDVETCTREISGELLDEGWIKSIELADRNGRIEFNSFYAESCLEHYERELRAAQCSYNFDVTFAQISDSESCQKVVVSKQLVGDVCATDMECDKGYCEPTSSASCGGICQRFAEAGEGCGFNSAVCADGLRCLVQNSDSTGECVGVGSRKNGQTCTLNEHCSRSSICFDGQCKTAMDFILKDVGESCHLNASGTACEAGYICGEVDEFSFGTCMAPLPQGSSCAYHGACASGLTCRVSNGGATCQPQSKIGQACSSSLDCEAGVCAKGKCQEFGACDPE